MYNKKLVFWAACFGMLLFGIGLITLGSMVSDLKIKFHLDDVGAGTLFSILPLGILAGSLLSGPICDRYGYKSLLVVSCLMMFGGFEGIAFADSTSLLKLCIFLFGFGAGLMNGATNSVVADISSEAKGANLSLLGVFFGIGALGMPFIVGILKNSFSSFQIVAFVGWFCLAVAVFYSLIHFPRSKKQLGFTEKKTKRLLRERFLYFLAFYLFFQGSFEAIANNWTTTYLTSHLSVSESNALYGLSLYVLGMTIARLFIGSLFRTVEEKKLMLASLMIIFLSMVIIHFSESYFLSITGLIMMGIGLAAGFPIIMGLAGSRFAAQSATAISFVLTFALLGNMLVNYLMGIVSKRYGIHHFTTFLFIELICMFVFCLLLFTPQKNKS